MRMATPATWNPLAYAGSSIDDEAGDVGLSKGLSPAISIERHASHNPRSVVISRSTTCLRLLCPRQAPRCRTGRLPLEARYQQMVVDDYQHAGNKADNR